MLSREYLGWGENSDLYPLPSFTTLKYRMDGSNEDDDSLTGSDISLEEALHRMSSLHIFEYLEEDDLLSIGQLVWQMGDDFFDEFGIERDGERPSLTQFLPLFFAEESRILEMEEFLVGELRSRPFKIRLVCGEMDREEIFFFTSESFFLSDLFGDDLWNRLKIPLYERDFIFKPRPVDVIAIRIHRLNRRAIRLKVFDIRTRK